MTLSLICHLILGNCSVIALSWLCHDSVMTVSLWGTSGLRSTGICESKWTDGIWADDSFVKSKSKAIDQELMKEEVIISIRKLRFCQPSWKIEFICCCRLVPILWWRADLGIIGKSFLYWMNGDCAVLDVSIWVPFNLTSFSLSWLCHDSVIASSVMTLSWLCHYSVIASSVIALSPLCHCSVMTLSLLCHCYVIKIALTYLQDLCR